MLTVAEDEITVGLPVTIPVTPSTVAIDELAVCHVPPVPVVDNVAEAPAHTAAVPLIVPAFGEGLTVTTAVAIDVLQAFVEV